MPVSPLLTSDKMLTPGGLKKFKIMAFLLLLLGGCAGGAERSITPGKTTAAELTATLGNAVVSGESGIRPQTEIRTYSECDYQIEQGVVTAKYCKPLEHEQTLQYWRQIWRNENASFEAVTGDAGPHGPDRYLLKATGLKKAVMYSRALDRVIQVIDYNVAQAGGTTHGR